MIKTPSNICLYIIYVSLILLSSLNWISIMAKMVDGWLAGSCTCVVFLLVLISFDHRYPSWFDHLRLLRLFQSSQNAIFYSQLPRIVLIHHHLRFQMELNELFVGEFLLGRLHIILLRRKLNVDNISEMCLSAIISISIPDFQWRNFRLIGFSCILKAVFYFNLSAFPFRPQKNVMNFKSISKISPI